MYQYAELLVSQQSDIYQYAELLISQQHKMYHYSQLLISQQHKMYRYSQLLISQQSDIFRQVDFHKYQQSDIFRQADFHKLLIKILNVLTFSIFYKNIQNLTKSPKNTPCSEYPWEHFPIYKICVLRKNKRKQNKKSLPLISQAGLFV